LYLSLSANILAIQVAFSGYVLSSNINFLDLL